MAPSPDKPFRKKVLVLGASGLIGSAIVRGLLDAGHDVVALARNIAPAQRRQPGAHWLSLDISRLVRPDDWSHSLSGIDGVIDAAGALQDGPADNLQALQRATLALFAACAASKLCLVHVSAAGVEVANAPFMVNKRDADAALQALDFDWTILRPGFVLSPVAYGGSAMLRALAALPFMVPVTFADRTLRSVHVDEVVAAALACLEGRVPARQVYDLVAGEPERFEDIVLALRGWLGLRPVPVIDLPASLVRPLFLMGDLVGLLGWRSAMRSASFDQLTIGIDGDPTAWQRASGRTLAGAASSLGRMPAGVQELWFARLWTLKPVVIGVLALFWLLSGGIGLARWQEAMVVLTARGTPEALAMIAVVGGGIADILIGLAIALRRSARAGMIAALTLSAAYLLGAVALAPDLWLDPLGPMLKVLPGMILTLVALALLEDR